MNFMNEFAKWLNDTMNSMGFTQESLGNKIGVAHVTIGKWQRGKHLPDPLSLRELATVTGTPVIRLFQMAGYFPADVVEQGETPITDYRTHDIISIAKQLNDEDRQALLQMARHLKKIREEKKE